MRIIPPVTYRHQSPFEQHASSVPDPLARQLSSSGCSPSIFHPDPAAEVPVATSPQNNKKKLDVPQFSIPQFPITPLLAVCWSALLLPNKGSTTQEKASSATIRKNDHHEQHFVGQQAFPHIQPEVANRYHIYEPVTY